MSLELKQQLVAFFGASLTDHRRALFHHVLSSRTRYLRLVLDGVENIGDACAVMRSCECFGIQNLDLIGTKAFRPARGIAVGASKWIEVKHHASDGDAFYQELKRGGTQIAVLGEDEDAIALHELPFDHRLALVLPGPAGSSGVTNRAADVQVRLPTVGFTTSFNLSVTAALCLSSLGERLRSSDKPWQLSEEDHLDLALIWMLNMPKRVAPMATRFLEENQLSRRDLEQALPDAAIQLMFPPKR